MAPQSITVSRLLQSHLLSNTIVQVLSEATPISGPEEVDVLSFLVAVATNPSRARFVRSSTFAVFSKAVRAHKIEPFGGDAPNGDWRVSPGLEHAFDAAKAHRREVGGKDSYLGLRHVLFVILTSSEPPLSVETAAALAALKVDSNAAAYQAARDIIDYRERAEDPLVLSAIMTRHGFDALADALAERAGPAKTTRARQKSRGKETGPNQSAISAVDAGVAISAPDDPWAPGLEDRAGAGREARAFAEMIAATSFNPPLAVGVFGDWGSGKSFFMRLIYDELVRIRGLAAESEAREADSITFLRHVVPIRFNAWHYVETNLWASLVDHIFTSLDRWALEDKTGAVNQVLEKLSTARHLTLEAAENLVSRRQDLRQAAQAQETARAELARARMNAQQSPAVMANAAWITVSGDAELRALRDTAAQRLGLSQLASSAESFTGAVARLDDELVKKAVWRDAILRSFFTPWGLAAAAAAVLLAWIVALYAGEINQMLGAAGAVGGLVAPLVTAAMLFSRQVNKVMGGLTRFRTSFEEQIARETGTERVADEEAARNLASAQAQSVEAEERFRAARESVAEAARDYNGESGRGRIMHFVKARVASGDYARNLGFVATVRKDFEELSVLMTAPAAVPDEAVKAREVHQKRVGELIVRAADLLSVSEKKKLQDTTTEGKQPDRIFERIVLFVDDLDRCPPAKVVEVLQAIHLLLAFPLFVVFVAVDVRWLRNALTKQYDGQIVADGSGGLATPGDYLEKIFQLPYWVRPLAGDSTVSLLADHLRFDEAPELKETAKGASKGVVDESQGKIPAATAGKKRTRQASSAGEASKTSTVEARSARLRIGKVEAEFIKKLGLVLDGSPRRTLRFINTYRVIKASLPREEVAALERADHRALLSLLAISIAADAVYPYLARELSGNGPLGVKWISDIPYSHNVEQRERKIATAIINAMNPRASDQAALRRLAPLIERFSFQPELAHALATSAPATP